MFTKKHFETVATSLRARLENRDTANASASTDLATIRVWYAIATDMRAMFAESNPRFDKEKFNDVSGITSVEYLHPSL